MVEAVIGAAGVQDVYSQEQLDGLREGLLPLFQKTVEDTGDAAPDK